MKYGSSNVKSDNSSAVVMGCKHGMKGSAIALVSIFIILVIATACREEGKLDVAAKINPKRMATMTTKNVATFISDSGVVQYKIVAPLWQVFEEADTPHWSFPQGLYLQKYDPYFHVVATVAADSAKFFSNQKLWRLDGHVELTKVPKDLFQTAQLFWDQRRGIIYSDSFIHIETETHVLEGLGFESDERLSAYRVIKPQGIFPVDSRDLSSNPENTSSQPTPAPAPSSMAGPLKSTL